MSISVKPPPPQRRLSRDSWLAIGLILLLVLISAAAGAQQTAGQNIPALASFSVRSDGSRALREWLDALGYTTLDTTNSYFEIPDQTKLVLILEPKTSISDSEWGNLDEWIETGGVLFIVGNNAPARSAMQHFDFNVLYLLDTAKELALQTPWLAAPPARPLNQRARRGIPGPVTVKRTVLRRLRNSSGCWWKSGAGFAAKRRRVGNFEHSHLPLLQRRIERTGQPGAAAQPAGPGSKPGTGLVR